MQVEPAPRDDVAIVHALETHVQLGGAGGLEPGGRLRIEYVAHLGLGQLAIEVEACILDVVDLDSEIHGLGRNKGRAI